MERGESIAFELEGALLASGSLFPYFMLVCLEAGAGGPLRAVVLLLAAPLLRLLELAGLEAAAVSAMIFLSTAGLRVDDLKAVAKATLPKFFMEDLRRGALREFLNEGGGGGGALRYVATALPRAMAEPFLREYLDADGVLGTELRTCMGFYTGLTSAAGVMDGERRLEALRVATAGTSVITVGARRKHPHQSPLSFYAKQPSTPPEDPKQPRPRSEYPRPLIFHDGRLVQRPTPLDFLTVLVWLPFGIFLAVLRVLIGLLAPRQLTIMGLAATGMRIEIQGHQAHLDANSTMVKGSGSHTLFVCNHRTLLDPVLVSIVLQRKLTALTYSLSRLSEVISPIPTVRLARDRLQDGVKMRSLVEQGDVIVCPEGTTCREPYLLRFSPLFAKIVSDVVPVAVTNGGSMFYGTTVRGHKCFDCFFFLMNPRPFYGLRFLEKVVQPHGRQRSEYDVANEVQRSIGQSIGFECTNLTRKDKYRILAGNDGLDPRM
ncbi:glycerol-3-phosphate acyltransferase RAM2-like [Zingiber officinale]|uniref:glycerol-3-phosphate acyltransferase RAM2-like n=1 Tax=Zingiber officinale TaxID=94328 RepID=UPI001C4C5E77|nr:glycerol-3-phosphate acyltransferase RAM2-like [Zingiber officinale]